MHIRVVNDDVDLSLNPRSCTFTVSLQQNGTVEGGTGQFEHATGTFTAEVNARGVLPRNQDGSCSDTQAPRTEVDTISASGTLTF
jgi:hypothetical protein